MCLRGLEQPARLVGDEHLVADPLDGGGGLRSSRGAARRHHRLLVPVEQLGDVPEIRKRRQVLA